MKKIILSAFVGISLLVSACNNTPTNAQNNVSVSHAPQQDVNVQSNDIPGFDVNAFANLLKQTTNPDVLTQAINDPKNNINNLDLDNDGNIDYLKVDQTGNTSLGVYDELPSGKVQVATLTVNTTNNSYAVTGTPAYCGPNYVYNSPTGLTFGDYMFLTWLMTPHHYYHPYWGYGRGYYGGYHPYRSRYGRPYTSSYARTRTTTTRTYTRPSTSSGYRQSTSSSYSKPSYSTTARTTVSAPASSQRSFNSGEGSRFRSSGSSSNGFRSSSSSSRSSFGRSSSSRSSFGGSRSSFGGRRR